jgi:hypothetical protein
VADSGLVVRGSRLPAGSIIAAAAVVVVLLLVAGRYGFHRDEYYFIESGHHPAWAEPDNPMLVPYLAAGWDAVVGGRLWAFRILPALSAAGYVLIAGLIAGELGGTRRHRIAASVATALTGLVLGSGHLFSTETFDMTVSALAVWLLIMAVRTDRWAAWLACGVATGVAMEIRMMAIFVIAALLLGLLIIGPRRAFGGAKLWAAAGLALLLASPNLIWQAAHGWPMRAIAANVAAGGSTSSTARAALIPDQLLLIGPIICVVLVVGVVWLLRRQRRRELGWIAVGYLIFVAVMLITGGKSYYPSPFFPALLAAGAIPLLDSIMRRRWRQVTALVLLIISAIITPLLALPVAPVGSSLFQAEVAVNPDGAETVGWNGYLHTVAGVARSLPAGPRGTAVIIASNYGEAGSLTLARREHTPDGQALPPVYSGHNGFGLWGPPPASANTVIAVGDFSESNLSTWFRSCRMVTHLTSPAGVDNQEAGAPVRICVGLRRSWTTLWPSIRVLG